MSSLPSNLIDPDLLEAENGSFAFQGRIFGAMSATKLAYAYAAQPTGSQGTPLTNRENVNVSINGSTQPIEFVIDSGADFNIIRTESANLISFKQTNPIRQQSITTAGGQTHQAPVFNAQFSIEGQPATAVELVVFAESPFNLITTATIAQSFTTTINTDGSFSLVPKSVTTAVPPPVVTTTATPPLPTIKSIGDVITELYRVICTANSKIPFICKSPENLTIALAVLVVLIIVFAFRG